MSTATTTTSTTTTTTPRTTTTQVATTTIRVNAAASDQLLYVTNRPWDTMNHFNPAGSGGNGIDYPLIPSRPSYNKRRGTTLNAKPPVHDSITCNTRQPTGRTSLHDQHCHHHLSLSRLSLRINPLLFKINKTFDLAELSAFFTDATLLSPMGQDLSSRRPTVPSNEKVVLSIFS
jgi:hypothetical protein